MANSCCDMETMTHLLQEKERDLELAAKIGQSLLEANQQMQTRMDALEQDVRCANERVAQLSHELRLKNDMPKVYLREEEAEAESERATQAQVHTQSDLMSVNKVQPPRRVTGQSNNNSVPQSSGWEGTCFAKSEANTINIHSYSNDEPDANTQSSSQLVASLNCALDELQERVASLERENSSLRSQRSELKRDERELVVAEQTLVTEVIRQLGDANARIVSLSEDVTRKTDLFIKQQENSSGLLASNMELETRIYRLASEKEEIDKRLHESHSVQRELTSELGELRARVAELSASLTESQDEVRSLRRRRGVHAHGAIDMALSIYSLNDHSLAAEISDVVDSVAMCSSTYELGVDSQQPNAALFSTLSALHTAQPKYTTRSCATASTSGNESMDEQMTVHTASTFASGADRPSLLSSQDLQIDEWRSVSSTDSMLTLEIGTSSVSQTVEQTSSVSTSTQNASSNGNGISSLKLSSQDRVAATTGVADSQSKKDRPTSSVSRRIGYPKVQMVKPLAGSLTLTWWQQLATPSLANVLQRKAGIQTRGDALTTSSFDDEKLTLSEVDEDEERERIETRQVNWKSANDTRCTFTYSTSRILHPTDINVYKPSCVATQAKNAVSTVVSMNTNTNTVFSSSCASSVRVATHHSNQASSNIPRQPASTFSVSLGLAELLNERGTPRAIDQLGTDLNSDSTSCHSQAVRFPVLSNPSVMTSSRSITERLYAPPLPGAASTEASSTCTPTLDSKTENATALNLAKLDYFGIFNLVKTVTERVLAVGTGTDTQSQATSKDNQVASDHVCKCEGTCVCAAQQDTLKPLWRPAPGTLSDKTLRYVASSPNLQQNATNKSSPVDSPLRKQVVPGTNSPLKQASSPARNVPSQSMSSPRGLNLLASTNVECPPSPKVVLRASTLDTSSDGLLIATRAQTSLINTSQSQSATGSLI